MVLKLANNATSTLAANINAGAGTIAIQSADEAKFPLLSTGDWFPVTVVDGAGNMEIMKCTARSGVNLTVARAQEGTAAKSFSAGARVDLRLTAAALDTYRTSAVSKAGDTMSGILNINYGGRNVELSNNGIRFQGSGNGTIVNHVIGGSVFLGTSNTVIADRTNVELKPDGTTWFNYSVNTVGAYTALRTFNDATLGENLAAGLQFSQPNTSDGAPDYGGMLMYGGGGSRSFQLQVSKSGDIYARGSMDGPWSSWNKFWHSNNFNPNDYAYRTRQVNSGTGLTGGGDLSANRTLAVNFGTSGGTVAAGNDSRIVNAVPNSRQVLAGTGMTGGGNLGGDRYLNLGTPSSITNSTTNSVSSTSHTHALGFTAAEVYTGSTQNETNLPVGHVVWAALDATGNRNESKTICLHNSVSAGYILSGLTGAGSALAGTWRIRGKTTAVEREALLQRTA